MVTTRSLPFLKFLVILAKNFWQGPLVVWFCLLLLPSYSGIIFVSHHRPFWTYESALFQPIHVGKAMSQIELNMPGDNTGDNISDKNDLYCELTAMYWVWKNWPVGDFVGFFHYRRYLDTSGSVAPFAYPLLYQSTGQCIMQMELLAHGHVQEGFINEENICKWMREYDLILPFEYCLGGQSVSEQARDAYTHWDPVLLYLLDKYPQHRQLIYRMTKDAHMGYMMNMFIMRGALFGEYMEWLFSFLFEMEELFAHFPRISMQRAYGHWAERLLNVFLAIKNQERPLKIKKLPTMLIRDVADLPYMFWYNQFWWSSEWSQSSVAPSENFEH